MKNRMFLMFAVGLLSVMPEIKAQSIARYFFQMPTNLLPTVSLDSRKDLVDFYKNDKAAVMSSVIGGEVVLKELSDDFLLLQTSESGDLQMKLLQYNDTSRIIALVHTVAAPLKDSRITFYSTSWQPIKDIIAPTISYMDFLDKEKGQALGLADRFNEICLRIFISYKFNQNSYLLVARSSLKDDVRSEIKKDFEPVIRDSLVFKWQNGKFISQNM